MNHCPDPSETCTVQYENSDAGAAFTTGVDYGDDGATMSPHARSTSHSRQKSTLPASICR